MQQIPGCGLADEKVAAVDDVRSWTRIKVQQVGLRKRGLNWSRCTVEILTGESSVPLFPVDAQRSIVCCHRGNVCAQAQRCPGCPACFLQHGLQRFLHHDLAHALLRRCLPGLHIIMALASCQPGRLDLSLFAHRARASNCIMSTGRTQT